MPDVIEKIELAEGELPCYDPDCVGVAVVERDGDHQWHECQDCGYQFGWEQVGLPSGEDGACSIGVPEALRRQASAPMEQALRDNNVNLGSTIPVRRG